MIRDTITAISTPVSACAIGIIRISGADSFKIIKSVFIPKKSFDISSVSSHTVHYGHICDYNHTPIDEVLVTILRSPSTYTKEDTVEISCHGNPFILQKILEIIIKSGARLAEPGEFTKRAFLNGRIDLCQAEAVIDLINSKTEAESQLAYKHINGYLSRYVKSTQDYIKEILMQLEANIDFPEDVIQQIDYSQIKEKLCDLIKSIDNIIDSYIKGDLIKDGISIAIIGKPNVGKSSLFNILTNKPQRALVTHVPGTTRDLLDEKVNIKGTLFRFYDTAGLRKPKGIVEEKSLGLSLICINESDFIIFILDSSKPLSVNDLELYELIKNKRNIVVLNKCDLKQKVSLSRLYDKLKIKDFITISCKENLGMEKLRSTLLERSQENFHYSNNSDIVISNIRHKNSLEKTKNCLINAINALNNKLSVEFISSDIKQSLENLQEITGERITENILDEIFSSFCIGK